MQEENGNIIPNVNQYIRELNAYQYEDLDSIFVPKL